MKYIIGYVFLGVATLVIVLSTQTAVATSFLTCSNFTGTKHDDCKYITSQGFEKDEEQQLLGALWEQSYEFDLYSPPDYPALDVDLTLEADEIDTSDFILASKIIAFIALNYGLISFTKWSVVVRWLSVAS